MPLNVDVATTDGMVVIGVGHIHKTAGHTLQGPHGRRRFYPRLRSILGHGVRVYTGLEREIPDIEYVTFLREPIVRTASHYQYDVQRGGVDLPFDEWITHDAVRDRQTRIIP